MEKLQIMNVGRCCYVVQGECVKPLDVVNLEEDVARELVASYSKDFKLVASPESVVENSKEKTLAKKR